MDTHAIEDPVIRDVTHGRGFRGTPEITNVQYDLWSLRISLKFPEVAQPAYVTFDSVMGFRVLDEGDLLEFWGGQTDQGGWLWQVDQGGWFDLEAIRDGFVSGLTGNYKEFLIAGINECVSVIAHESPSVSTARG